MDRVIICIKCYLMYANHTYYQYDDGAKANGNCVESKLELGNTMIAQTKPVGIIDVWRISCCQVKLFHEKAYVNILILTTMKKNLVPVSHITINLNRYLIHN